MTRSAARTTLALESDPPFYGWRYIRTVRPDGTEDLLEVSLTLEDVLHPQVDDVIPEVPRQQIDICYLAPILRYRAERLPGGYYVGKCVVDWGVPGILPHAPDFTLFRHVTIPPQGNFGIFPLRDSGGRCVLVVEIVTPHTRVNDVVHKFREYHQVRVPLYVLIDQEPMIGARQVVGYRYTPDRYVRMRLDGQGRLLLKPIGLWLSIADHQVVCHDADTGERLRTYSEIVDEHRTECKVHLAKEQRLRELELRIRKLDAELRHARGAK